MTVYPIAHALWTCLHEVMLLFPGEPFVGLGNYRRVVTGNYFSVALRNSLLFTAVAAPLVVTIGTLIALFLQRRFLGSQVVRSVVLLPWVLPGRHLRGALGLGIPSELRRSSTGCCSISA